MSSGRDGRRGRPSKHEHKSSHRSSDDETLVNYYPSKAAEQRMAEQISSLSKQNGALKDQLYAAEKRATRLGVEIQEKNQDMKDAAKRIRDLEHELSVQRSLAESMSRMSLGDNYSTRTEHGSHVPKSSATRRPPEPREVRFGDPPRVSLATNYAAPNPQPDGGYHYEPLSAGLSHRGRR